jgi:hypothetical protein
MYKGFLDYFALPHLPIVDEATFQGTAHMCAAGCVFPRIATACYVIIESCSILPATAHSKGHQDLIPFSKYRCGWAWSCQLNVGSTTLLHDAVGI